MSLAFTPDQPADPGPRALVATVISIDSTPVRLFAETDGALVILVGGRQPVTLDRFQAGALRAALCGEVRQ